MTQTRRARLRDLVEPLRARQRVLVVLALALLFTYGYFVSPPAWNQNSRLALTRALVETRSVVIDPYHETTGDKSFVDGHFYSDKAPGASFVATIPYGVFWGLRRLGGGELPSVRVQPLDPLDAATGRAPSVSERKPGDKLIYNLAHRLALYLCALVAVAMFSVAGCAAVFLVARRLAGGHDRTAIAVALTYALGTTAFAYSTVFYGHQLCAAALFCGFAIVALSDPWRGAGPDMDPTLGRATAAAAGCALGLAVTTEYPALVPAVVIAGWAAYRHGWRFAWWLGLGALPWALALAAYHHAAFGSVFATGYDFVYREEFAAGMHERYGVGFPDPRVLLSILFGQYRGLFYLCPVLLLAAWGLARLMDRPPGDASTSRGDGLDRASIGIAIFVVVYYLLLNAGYYMWDGGASTGPRHVVPALGFLALGLVAAFKTVPRATAVLAGVSILHMLLMAAAAPEAAQHGNPLWEYALGRISNREVLVQSSATNLGLLLGLPGLVSLVPLLALWAWLAPMALRGGDLRGGGWLKNDR